MPGGLVDTELAAAGVVEAFPSVGPSEALWAAPNGDPLLYVLYKPNSPGVDLYTVGAIRQQTDPLWVVVVVGRVTDVGLLSVAAKRIDTLLHGSMGGVEGGYVQACVREAPHEMGPLFSAGDVSLYELGGRYRLYIREE